MTKWIVSTPLKGTNLMKNFVCFTEVELIKLLEQYPDASVEMKDSHLEDHAPLPLTDDQQEVLEWLQIYADTYWHNYAEVFQQPNGAYRLRGKGIYETELYGNRKQVTLTGNIYETPELLENDRFCTETDDPDY